MIPIVASITSIKNSILDSDIDSDISLGKSLGMASCIPIVDEPFEETRKFNWNVENFIHKKMSFTYYVGEGPLYWYRIDWYPSVCPPISCVEMSPMISYIAPNCPYEIIESCIILPPDCNNCAISCIPGTCISQTVEVWHMLATSVIHLCERINQECCHRKPPGYMRRVRQYMRPALCCDVAAHGAIDKYEDVNFLKCECGNLVDPCIAKIIYPCHINRCGIHGPAFNGGSVPPISSIKMAPDLLGHMPMPMQDAVSAMPMPVQMVPPKEAQPVSRIINKYGSSIPELIHCNHNLSETNILKDYLKSNKINFSNIDLFYNKEYNSWHGSKVFKDWKIAMEWIPEKNTYKLNISVTNNKNLKTKISLSAKTENFINNNNFEIECNFNTSSGVLSSKKSILQSRMIKDDIGLFKNNWRNNLQLVLKG